MKIATLAPGREGHVAGFDFTVKRETTIELTQSPKTGNALITVVGEVQVNDAVPVVNADVDINAAAYDIGTQEWEAHGTATALGPLSPSVHAKGNEDGATGACFIICVPLTPDK